MGRITSTRAKLRSESIRAEGQNVSELRRWYSETDDVRVDQQIAKQILEYLEQQAVRSVVGVDRIIGCPHEEGIDYADDAVCPASPYWANRNRFTHEINH